MIVSNEPGFYKTGAYGIRIENLQVVTPAADIPGGERPMLAFETLTLAPIDRRLIEPALLNATEKEWLNAYHARVMGVIGPLVPDEVRPWLETATAAV
jgi:Xaa-Pro aminopeptidase